MTAAEGTRAALAIVEAAYRWMPDERAWVDGLVDAASLVHPIAGVYTMDIAPDGQPRARTMRLVGALERYNTFFPLLISTAPPLFVRSVHQPRGHLMTSGPREAERAMETHPELRDWVERAKEMADEKIRCIIGGDPDFDICWVGWHAELHELAPVRKVLGRVAAHLGAAVRLRRGLTAQPNADDATNEAVLTPGGKVVHASDRAKTKHAMTSLAEAVVRSERARSKRHAGDEERLELWTALVEARWSIVETEDRDGKRFLVARRNAPTSPELPQLTERERVVATFAAHGYALKEIAYEVGLSVATVSATLHAALGKLNLRSRSDLTRLFGATRLELARGAH